MMNSPPGWYGKLPGFGDFASRRLAPEFIERWDAWLAAGLLLARERNEAGWLDAYLVSPSWRFVLLPGALEGELGRTAWAGVLMPSVDRVGRYFPFTLIQPLAALPDTGPQMQALWQWLGRLSELAADALAEDWNTERLEAELGRMAGPAPVQQGVDGADHIDREAHALWTAGAQGQACWYALGREGAPLWRVTQGLPATAATFLGLPQV